MMRLRTLAFAALAAFGFAGVANAQSLDWEGFYVGPSVGSYSEGSPYLVVGKSAGYNWLSDNILFGVDASVLRSPYNYFTSVVGRVGTVALDPVAIYALGGAGVYTGMSEGYYGLVGVGAELGLGDQVSLRGEWRSFSFPGAAFYGNTATVSLLYHP